MLFFIVGVACLCWYTALPFVCALGYVQIYRNYRRRPRQSQVENLADQQSIPHVTIIRPVKGLEPDLYQCLASTLLQSYPPQKLTVCFCLADRRDPALPTLEALLRDFPHFDARLYIEDEDPRLQPGSHAGMGPNPKIRNISRAYREAAADVIWIVDCNVWVGKGVAGRMVDSLYGFHTGKPYKFVHQLPIVVDITNQSTGLLGQRQQAATTSTEASQTGAISHDNHGSPLEETFLTSAHAKFYTAINTVALAPCILGKSNMFRRSHLDALTGGQGLDFFSHNICEDHLIGDLLWKQPVPDVVADAEPDLDTVQRRGDYWGNHALCPGDLAIQPIAHMSLAEYIARRIRWLRVRKFTVTLATLVEPGTECFLSSAYGAFALTTLPWFREWGVPSSCTVFVLFWLLSVSIWAVADWTLYCLLMGMGSVEVDRDTPVWARGGRKRPFMQWIQGWLGREALALPIWLWAVWGGMTVLWRGRNFRVGMDMRVIALDEGPKVSGPATSSATPQGKATTTNGNRYKRRLE